MVGSFSRTSGGIARGVIFAGALLAAGLACAPLHAREGQAQAAPAVGDLAPDFQKSSHLFATKSGQKLYLDRTEAKDANATEKRPVLIYSFGGGWEGGSRADRISDDFLRYYAARGYVVIALDYRLAVKEAKAKGPVDATNFVETYLRAIQWGVEDLFDATAFVLKHADEWNIDKDQIIAVGSSAGATNSLVAEYHIANATPLARKHLPSGFNYAGVISMAGAFWLPQGTELTWKTKPAPIMFFHGAKDQLVTYDEAKAGFWGYGPVSFQRKFAGPDYPSWFVDLPDADHVVAVAPMLEYRNEIAAFLTKLVREKQQLSVHTVERGKVPKIFQNFGQLYGKYLATPGAATKQ